MRLVRGSFRLIAAFLAIGLLGGVLISCAPSQPAAPAPGAQAPATKADSKIVLRAITVNPPGSLPGNIFAWTAEEVSKRTGGRVTMEVYTPSSLGFGPGDYLEAVARGQVDVVEMLGGFNTQLGPITDIAWFLPHDREMEVNAFWPVYKEEIRRLTGEKYPVQVTAVGQLLPRYFFMTNEVTSLAALKGKKVRTAAPSYSDLLKLLDASPVVIPQAEMYMALKQGIAEGQINNPTSVVATKTNEVTSYLSIDSYLGGVDFQVVVNKSSWDNIPSDLKKTMEELFYTDVQKEMTTRYDNDLKNIESDMKAANVKIVRWSESDAKKFRAVVKQQEEGWKSSFGPKDKSIYDKVMKAIDDYNAKAKKN